MRSGLFSASMSGRPFSAFHHDQWIETTMNKCSKMKGGWIGIMHNEEARQVNNKVINITKGIIERNCQHKETPILPY